MHSIREHGGISVSLMVLVLAGMYASFLHLARILADAFCEEGKKNAKIT